MRFKKLLKYKDVTNLKRKIISWEIVKNKKYILDPDGIFKYENQLNYCGIPFDEIKKSKLKEYKRNYKIIERWMVWILNHLETKDDQKKYPNRIYFFYKYDFILGQDLKNKHFWASYSKIWSKIQSKFEYNYLITRNLLNSILEQHFNYKEFTTFHSDAYHKWLLEQHFNCKEFTTIFFGPF